MDEQSHGSDQPPWREQGGPIHVPGTGHLSCAAPSRGKLIT